MSPDPLLALIVDAIRRGGRANELMRDHQADHTLHCRICRCLSPCSIFSAALKAWEYEPVVLPKEWKRP